MKVANSNVGSKEVHILCGIYEIKFEEFWTEYLEKNSRKLVYKGGTDYNEYI